MCAKIGERKTLFGTMDNTISLLYKYSLQYSTAYHSTAYHSTSSTWREAK